MSLTSQLSSVFSHNDTSDASEQSSQHGLAESGHEINSTRQIATPGIVNMAPAAGLDDELKRPPYPHSMLAGGIGGTSGDILMHSLDTVKTRQQGDPHFPPKYTSLSDSYVKIFRQEGVKRGLYGGFTAAMLGSFPGTVIFFGTYEYCKRYMLDRGINPSLSYLTSGMSTAFLEEPMLTSPRLRC